MKEKLFLVYGEESYLINKKIEEIINNEPSIIYDMETMLFNDVKEDLLSYSLFYDKKVIVCKNCNFLTSSNDNKENLDTLGEVLKNDFDNKLILSVQSKIDERKKVIKELMRLGSVYVFNKLNEVETIKFISNEFDRLGYTIDISTLNYFYSFVGNNLDVISNEIDKLDLYKEDKIITKDDINNISSKAIENNIFELINAVSSKDIGKALLIYDDLLLINEEEVKMISILGDHFRLIFQTKTLIESNYSEYDISKELDVHPYRVKLARNSSISIEEAKNNMLKLFDLDVAIKTGKKDKKAAFRLYLLNM